MEKLVIVYDYTNAQLLESLEKVRHARIGIVSSGIDYKSKQLVLYAGDITISDKIK